MLRRLAAGALVMLLGACGARGSDDDGTITVAGQPVPVAPLVDAHAGLCQAADQPDAARRLFFDRSHEPLHTVARGLEDVDRPLAGQLLQAKEKVESGLGAPGPSLPDDLARLADVYRASLGRLAIEAPPCEK